MAYDAIIYLNNAAVKMLECNSCARESVVTFRDAMCVQRSLYSHRAATSVTNGQQEQQTCSISTHGDDFESVIIPNTIRNATKRLCNIPRKTTIIASKMSEWTSSDYLRPTGLLILEHFIPR